MFKTFLHIKNLWQVSFLFLLLPFLYLNKETFLPLVQLKNFYPLTYNIGMSNLLDNSINLKKYFYVLISFFLIILTYYFKKNNKEYILFKKISLININIFIFTFLIIFYSILKFNYSHQALILTIFFYFIFFFRNKKVFNALKYLSYFLLIFTTYKIIIFFHYASPLLHENNIFLIDMHYSALLLDNYRIVDGVNIFDDPGKSFQFSYGFLKNYYFFFFKSFFKLDTSFIFLFIKTLQIIFLILILFLSYLRFKKIYLFFFFISTSFFFSPSSWWIWWPNHTSLRYIFVIISFIFIWILLKRYNNRYPFLYSLVCFFSFLYNAETGLIIFISLFGLFFFSGENYKKILVFVFTFFFLNLFLYYAFYLNNYDFTYLSFLKSWAYSKENGQIGGSNYIVYTPFICMLLHSLICICRNVSLRLKNVKLKFDFLISSFFIGFAFYFVFRSSWEYLNFLFVIYSFIFLRLKSDVRWFFNNNYTYLSKIITVFLIYSFSYHLISVVRDSDRNFLFKFKSPKNVGFVKPNKFLQDSKDYQNIRESCAFLKKYENNVEIYFTPFNFLTRSACGTKNLSKTKRIDTLIYKDEYFNFIKYYLPDKFILSKIDAYGPSIFPNYTDFYKDLIFQIESNNYLIIDSDKYWLVYEKNKY
jgi:hypothetical protein